MSQFDAVAREWDMNKMHQDRTLAIAKEMAKVIPFNKEWSVLEFGAGTGLLSFHLKDRFKQITLVDSSSEMIKVCEEKSVALNTSHIYPICIDLQHNVLDRRFDLIYSQMALHHVGDVVDVFKTFYELLNIGGYLSIVDLYSEDGSFHGPDAKVHLGFEPRELQIQLEKVGFKEVAFYSCYDLKRENGQVYPLFLLTAIK